MYVSAQYRSGAPSFADAFIQSNLQVKESSKASVQWKTLV